MKKRVIILWAAAIVFFGLVLWVLQSPYGYLFAALHKTSAFWIPIWLLIACGCAAAALFIRRKMRRDAGKKGIVPTVFGVICIVLAVAEGYVVMQQTSLKPEYSTLRLAAESPDGQHSVWRVKHSDIFGNTCYNYYQQVGTFRWAYAFDDDREELPQITWGETGLTVGAKTVEYRKKGY